MEHPDVEVQVARGRPTSCAASSRFVSGLVRVAEHLEDLQPQRVAERFELLGPLDLQDVLVAAVRDRACSSALQFRRCGGVEEDLDRDRCEPS